MFKNTSAGVLDFRVFPRRLFNLFCCDWGQVTTFWKLRSDQSSPVVFSFHPLCRQASASSIFANAWCMIQSNGLDTVLMGLDAISNLLRDFPSSRETREPWCLLLVIISSSQSPILGFISITDGRSSMKIRSVSCSRRSWYLFVAG